jgi:hypothetical protein
MTRPGRARLNRACPHRPVVRALSELRIDPSEPELDQGIAAIGFRNQAQPKPTFDLFTVVHVCSDAIMGQFPTSTVLVSGSV